jgi:branched-chain amino acid transport system permease protein
VADLAQIVVSGLLLGGVYALVSVGLTLVFGVIRLVNFAHGEYLMLAMYLTYFLFQYLGLDPLLAILVVAPALFLFGVITERLIIVPTLAAPHVVQVFATLGVSIVMQNLALFFWSANFRSVTTWYSTATFAVGPVLVSVPRLVAFAVAFAIALVLYVFLRTTWLGKAIQATAQHRHAAMLMGVDVGRIYRITFALGSACVGIAGALLLPIFPVYPQIGVDMILVAFVIVVLGGLGSVPGAMLGGLIIGVVETASGYVIETTWKQAVYFVLFIAILVLRPAGLFGVRGMEELGTR